MTFAVLLRTIAMRRVWPILQTLLFDDTALIVELPSSSWCELNATDHGADVVRCRQCPNQSFEDPVDRRENEKTENKKQTENHKTKLPGQAWAHT